MWDPKEKLQDPSAEPSEVWSAALRLLGVGARSHEPEAFRIELRRHGVDPSDALMAKLLAAQTVVQHPEMVMGDWEALFAFALAADGISADAEVGPLPTPEQLCWAVREIGALAEGSPGEEEGFDPDAVDPAIAAALLDEGYAVAPDDLAFAQHALDWLSPGHEGLRADVKAAWEPLSKAPLEEALKTISNYEEDDPKGVQLRRLADCRRYVAAREEAKARHVHSPDRLG